MSVGAAHPALCGRVSSSAVYKYKTRRQSLTPFSSSSSVSRSFSGASGGFHVPVACTCHRTCRTMALSNAPFVPSMRSVRESKRTFRVVFGTDRSGETKREAMEKMFHYTL